MISNSYTILYANHTAFLLFDTNLCSSPRQTLMLSSYIYREGKNSLFAASEFFVETRPYRRADQKSGVCIFVLKYV